MQTMDMNCDCGESFGNWSLGADEDLLPIISTANIACGFHGGDPIVMKQTVETARKHGTAVGSHPGLPDLVGFGRRSMTISPEDAYAMVLYQTGALKAFLDAAGMPLHHVKPHGALYGMLNNNDDLADAVSNAIVETCPDPVLYWPAPFGEHALPRAARACGITVVGEVYFDLSYDDEGRLVIERKKTAKDLNEVERRVRHFIRKREVTAISGRVIPVDAGSICIHGDGPNALEVAKTVIRVLGEEGIELAPAKAIKQETAP